MEFIVPESVKRVLGEFEARQQGFHEFDLSHAIENLAKQSVTLPDAERRGVWVEMIAFQLMEPSKTPQQPWNSVFAPMASMRTQNGEDRYIPDIKSADESVIFHWAERSRETTNPIICARYADLVWEFGPLVTKSKREIEFARRCIDAYLRAVETEYYVNNVQASTFLGRALSLSISINDPTLISRSKDAAFELHSRIGRFGKGSMWWVLFDTLYDEHVVGLTDTERATIIDGLEDVLKNASDRTQPDLFDPWAAQGAAERLERHYRKIQKLDEVRRVTETAGLSFEQAAHDAEPLLAVAWLQPVYEKYRDLGMQVAVNRVHLALEAKSKAAPASMKRLEVPIDIKPDEVVQSIETLTDGGLTKALLKVAVGFIPKANDLRGFNERMKDVAPLTSRIPMRIFEGDFASAVVGSQDDDPDGRLINQIGREISFNAPFLAMAFNRINERYQMTSGQLMELLASSPCFDDDRKGLLAEGIAAALSNDHVKAIHVLIPQIEHMLRMLAGQIGIPKTTAGSKKGTMQARTLGDILSDPVLKDTLDEDIRLYLVALLVDQRGLNLRNRVAHGLLEFNQLDHSFSNRVLHVLLTLRLISVEIRETTQRFFRVVRHSYNDDGLLAERAVISGHRTKDEALEAAKSEAAKNSPWEFEQANNQWRMTDKHGKTHFVLVEEF